MADSNIRNLLENTTDFPSLPDIIQKVLILSGDPNASLLSISQIIEKDPALSTQVLKLVNSPLTPVARSIKNMKEAVPLVGAEEIRNITLMLSLLQMFPAEFAPFYEKIFQQSLCAAISSEFIAQKAGMKNQSDIFLAGLLLFIGKFLFVHYLSDQYVEVVNEAELRAIRLETVEREMLGLTNMEAGEILCRKWSLPDSISHSIVYRTDFQKGLKEANSAEDRDLIRATYLGGLASTIFFGWNKFNNIARFKTAYTKIGLSGMPKSDEFLKAIPEKLSIASAEFLIKIDKELNYPEMVHKAYSELDFSYKKHESTYLELQKYINHPPLVADIIL